MCNETGSIFGNFETAVLERSVSKEDFKQKGCLPEWMSCDSEHWETIKNISVRRPLMSSVGGAGGLKRELPPTVSLMKPSTTLKWWYNINLQHWQLKKNIIWIHSNSRICCWQVNIITAIANGNGGVTPSVYKLCLMFIDYGRGI